MPFKIKVEESRGHKGDGGHDFYHGEMVYEQQLENLDLPALIRFINAETGEAPWPKMLDNWVCENAACRASNAARFTRCRVCGIYKGSTTNFPSRD
jgi:hypothetical protein